MPYAGVTGGEEASATDQDQTMPRTPTTLARILDVAEADVTTRITLIEAATTGSLVEAVLPPFLGRVYSIGVSPCWDDIHPVFSDVSTVLVSHASPHTRCFLQIM